MQRSKVKMKIIQKKIKKSTKNRDELSKWIKQLTFNK